MVDIFLGFGILINGPQYFTHSSEIAIDSKDNVFVVDFGNPNYAIKEFDKNGAFNRSFGSFGLGPGKFVNPGGLGVDLESNMYTTNFGENNNIQIFQQRRKLFDNLGVSGRKNGQFENPIEITVYPEDDENVGDSSNNHVQVFGNNGNCLTRLDNTGPLRTIRESYRNRHKIYWKCICSGWKKF